MRNSENSEKMQYFNGFSIGILPQYYVWKMTIFEEFYYIEIEPALGCCELHLLQLLVNLVKNQLTPYH